jgi:hypothetical protein
MATTGCNVIVTATPVSDAKYFDKVIWKQMHALARKKKGKENIHEAKQIVANPRPFETQALPKKCREHDAPLEIQRQRVSENGHRN